jgi:hypothetical protein
MLRLIGFLAQVGIVLLVVKDIAPPWLLVVPAIYVLAHLISWTFYRGK